MQRSKKLILKIKKYYQMFKYDVMKLVLLIIARQEVDQIFKNGSKSIEHVCES